MPSTSISNRRVDVCGETRAQHEAPEGAFLGAAMVIILDRHKKPAGFTTEKHIRRLTEKHKAVIYRKFPCVAILTKADVRDFADVRSYRVKIDPGAKHTGIAVVCNETDEANREKRTSIRGVPHAGTAGTGRRATAGANTKADAAVSTPREKRTGSLRA